MTSTSLNIISLGAGVQSSAMALRAAKGEITPMPDAAIFADTQDEPQEVYAHLAWLKSVVPFPVIVGTNGKLSERLLAGDDEARHPFFIEGGSIQRRQCTRNYKIRVIRREVRKLMTQLGVKGTPKGFVSQWIGISTDEADRIKPSGVQYVVNRWPLLEESTAMSREDCAAWIMANYGRVAPKSSCKQCPFQDTARLIALKAKSPSEFDALCRFDEALRSPENVARFHGRVYVHRSRQPLAQIDLSPDNDAFSNECEGVCGV